MLFGHLSKEFLFAYVIYRFDIYFHPPVLLDQFLDLDLFYHL